MRIYSTAEIKNRFDLLGHQWLMGLNLVGVRSKEDKFNEFDDSFYLLDTKIRNRVFSTDCFKFSGTTNPGASWLQEKMNPKGCAVLKPGQYIDCWVLGKHRGAYDAWVQAKPVIVCRDKDKDQKSECNGLEEKGIFGINIHRSNENAVSKFINLWSAGCQVMNTPSEYSVFMIKSTESGQKFFSYTLLGEF